VEKGLKGAPEGNKNNNKSQCPQNEDIDLGRTCDVLAKEYGVNKSTIERSEKYSQAVDAVSAVTDDPTQTKNDILSGKINFTKKAIKDMAKTVREDPEDVKKQLANPPEKKTPRKNKSKTVKQFETPREAKGCVIVSDAMGIIKMCISQLTRIEPNDPLKNEAFDKLIKYMEDHR